MQLSQNNIQERGFSYEHHTTNEPVEGLPGELRRNEQLWVLCGFEPKAIKQKDGIIKIYVARLPVLTQIFAEPETVSEGTGRDVYRAG